MTKVYHLTASPAAATDNLRSEYLRLSDGIRIHYHRPHDLRSCPDLVIFIHGFPDSCYLWTDLLNSSVNQEANLIALDLPGFGKSEGLYRYGPDEMLTAICEAIVQFRKMYTCRRCIVVGHDWGGIIASRIGAQTQDLIDHLVLVNSLFVRCPIPLSERIPRLTNSSIRRLTFRT